MPLLIPLSDLFGMRCSEKTGSGLLFPPSSSLVLSLSESDKVEEDPVSDVDDVVDDEDDEMLATMFFST